MEVIGWVGIGVGVVGVIFGARCYVELWKWARDCQNARIAIAYKKKVVMSPPLVEWLLWCRRAKHDKTSAGQVVFSRAGVSVAVAQSVIPPGPIRRAIKHARTKRSSAAPPVREGTWSARDETVSTNGR